MSLIAYFVIRYYLEVLAFISQEEAQYDIYSKEYVNDLIEDKEAIGLVFRESKVDRCEIACEDQEKSKEKVPHLFIQTFRIDVPLMITIYFLILIAFAILISYHIRDLICLIITLPEIIVVEVNFDLSLLP